MQTIIRIMQAQYEVYAALLALAKSKPAILDKNDIDALQEQTKQEETLVSRAVALEQERLEEMRRLAAVPKREAAEYTLSDLIAQAGDMTASALTITGERLADCLKQLKLQNHLNRQLVEMNMNFTSFMLDTITHRNTPSGVYGESGIELEGQDTGFTLFNSEV